LKTASRQHSLIITETSLFKAQFFEDSQTHCVPAIHYIHCSVEITQVINIPVEVHVAKCWCYVIITVLNGTAAMYF